MTEPGLRVDKWLWHARFFKSRSLATRHCAGGRMRINGNRVIRAHAVVRPGDILTFPKGPHIRVVQIAALGHRRGPAVEAADLYEDLAPPPKKTSGATGSALKLGKRDRGAGRPTKLERRETDRLKGQ